MQLVFIAPPGIVLGGAITFCVIDIPELIPF
jgi:hypothetical protein